MVESGGPFPRLIRRMNSSSLKRVFVVGLMFCLHGSHQQGVVAETPPLQQEETSRGQVADAAEVAVSAQKFVERLSHRRFKRRQDAEAALWAMGPSIEPILIELLADADLETRERIRSIREKFAMGITPDMPPKVRHWITTAINSRSDKERRIATAEIAKLGHFNAVIKVIERLQSPRSRGDYISMIMTQMKEVKPSVQSDAFHFRLLRLAVKEPNPVDVGRLVGYVLRSNQVRQRSARPEWIAKFVELVRDSPNHAVRRSLIDGIYFDSNTIRNSVSLDLMVQWIDLVADESDRMTRHRYVSKLLSSSALLSSYGSSAGKKSFKLDELYDRLSQSGRNALVDAAANVPSALALIHKEAGDRSMLRSAASTKDDSIRGNLIGRLASLPNWPSDKSAKHELLELIEREPNGSAKSQMAMGYLQGLTRQPYNEDKPSQEVIKEIWASLNTTEDKPWQLLALLETYSLPRQFSALQTKETLEKMLRIAVIASPSDVQTFAYAPISKTQFANELKKQGMGVAFIRTLAAVPATTRISSRFNSLLASSQFTNTLRDAKDRRALIDVLQDRLDENAKRYALMGVVRNKDLLRQLFAEGQFEATKAAMLEGIDERRRAEFLGKLYINEATIEYLTSKNRVNELLDLETQKLSSDSQELVLMQILGSDPAVTAILKAGHYETLLKSVAGVAKDSRRQDLMRRLMTRKAYARALAKEGSLATTLLNLSRNTNWMSSRGYVNLISNLTQADVVNEPKLALSFWDFAKQLPRSYDKRQCIAALFGSEWFFPQMQRNKRFAQLASEASTAISSSDYKSVLGSMVRQPSVAYFFEEARLGLLVNLCGPLQGTDRLSFYRTISHSSHVQKWFAGSDQPRKLVAELNSIDVKRRGEFIGQFLGSGLLNRQRQNKRLVPELVLFTNSQPKSVQLQMALVLLSDYTTRQAVADTDLMDLVTSSLLTRGVDHDVLLKALSNTTIVSELKKRRKLRVVLDLIFAWPDKQHRKTLAQRALLNSYFQAAMTDDELRQVIDDYLVEFNKNKSGFLLSSLLVNSRVVQLGYFDSLRTLVDAGHSNGSVNEIQRWSFYTNTAVVHRMRKIDPKAKTLSQLIDDTRSSSLYGRLAQMIQNPTAVEWALDGQGVALLAKAIAKVDNKSRSYLVRSLATSWQVSNLLAERGLLKDLFEIDVVKATMLENEQYLSLLNATVLKSDGMRQVLLPLITQSLDKESNRAKRQRLVSSLRRSDLQNVIVDRGDGAWLLKTLLGECERDKPDDVSIDAVRSATLGYNGPFTVAIMMGDWDTADELLSQFVADDNGKLRLIRFRMICAKFGVKLSRREPAFKAAEESDRYAFFKLRSENRFDEAEKIAADAGDPALRWALRMETHDHEQLVQMPVPRASAMPQSQVRTAISPLHRQIETLGFQIVTKQLAGAYASAEDETADVRQLQNFVEDNPTDLSIAGFVSDALLSANRAEKSLTLLDEKLPHRAFYWHWERLEFDEALQVIGWDPQRCDQLFDSIAGQPQPTSNANAIGRGKGQERLLHLAVMLKAAGKTADLLAVMRTLRRHAVRGLTDPQRKQHLEALAARLYKANLKSQSRGVFAEFAGDAESRSRYFSSVYSSDKLPLAWREAEKWWLNFSKDAPATKAVDRLARVDSAMLAKSPVKQLERFFIKKEDSSGTESIKPVPYTQFRYGQVRAARENAIFKRTRYYGDWELIARTFLAEGNFAEAAEAFHESWKRNAANHRQLFLAADCLRKAGDAQAAMKMKLQARLLALANDNERALAAGLLSESLVASALEIHRDLLRTTLPCHPSRIAAIPLVARSLPKAVDRWNLWQEHDLYHLRPTNLHRDLRVWVYHASKRHALRAQVAIDEGDFVAAEESWRDMATVSKAHTRLLLPILAKLKEENRNELADRIHQAHERYLSQKLQQYPNSPAVKEHVSLLQQYGKPVKHENKNPQETATP